MSIGIRNSPDLDGECQSSAHARLGIGAHVVGETVVKHAVDGANGLLRQDLIHGDTHQLERSESASLDDAHHRRALRW